MMMRVFCNADSADEEQYDYYDYWHLTLCATACAVCVCVCVCVSAPPICCAAGGLIKKGQKVVRGERVPRTRDSPARDGAACAMRFECAGQYRFA
ncbi:hypothetical protein CUR178_05374 [Leishmania enriettii]|uniref:Uncharacterized protein n=1 Tax=Leishmania enriettii TaxID=5663 RepID=A0A836HIZ4_LEIEN|nr:hypothetical protein CUR178_05374 [Leishmania enriettii]